MTNKKSNYMSEMFRKTSGFFQKNTMMRTVKKIMYYIDGFILMTIKKPNYIEHSKKKVLIIYNLALGDGVIWRCSALQLRKIYPHDKYELTLLCQKGINKLYENDDLFDEIIPIDFNASTINLKIRRENYKAIRNIYYDIVIDPVGIFEWTTNILYTRAICSKCKIGVIDTNIKNYCSMKKINGIYTKIIKITKPKLSLLEYYGEIINKLSNNSLNFSVGFEQLKINNSKVKLPSKYFIVFPSASMQLKRWSIDKYVYIAEQIYKKTNMGLVLVGTSSDYDSLNEFKGKIGIPYIDLIEKTNLNDYFNIINKASLLITNDTSAYHIALVEETPVVIITGGYTYYRYVEYNFKRMNEFKKPCIIVHNMPCFNCNNRCKYLKKGDTNWPCLESITKEYAWKKINKFIDDNHIGG